jgi:prevent-host-death family protein
MISIKPSEDIVPMSEFRNNLSDCATHARKSGRPLLLTQNGRASYVFMDLTTFEEIREKLEKMEAYEDLLAAEGEADRDEVVSIDNFEKEIRERRAKEDRKAKSKTNRIRVAV